MQLFKRQSFCFRSQELKCLAELGYEIDSGKAKETAEARPGPSRAF